MLFCLVHLPRWQMEHNIEETLPPVPSCFVEYFAGLHGVNVQCKHVQNHFAFCTWRLQYGRLNANNFFQTIL